MSDTTSPSPRKYPKRWLAVLLSIPWPGLGFAYLGRGVASFVVFATLLACWWITLACAFTGHFTFTIFVATWAIYLVAWLTAIVAVFFAARRPRQSPRPAYSRWYGLIAVLVTWMLCWLVPRIFVPTPIEAFSIPAGSMVPALMPGDHLMSIHWDQLHRAPQRGEIVVLRPALSAAATSSNVSLVCRATRFS